MKKLLLVLALLPLCTVAQDKEKKVLDLKPDKLFIISESELEGLITYTGENLLTKQGLPIIMLTEQIRQRGPINTVKPDSVAKKPVEKSKKK